MFTAIAALVITNFASIYGWINTHKASKRKANAEADIKEADVRLKELSETEKIIEIYNKLNVDLKANYDKRIEDMKTDYDKKINGCNSEIENCKQEIKLLKSLKCEKTNCADRI